MAYDQKTQEIDLYDIEEILSEAEEELLESFNVDYEISDAFIEPLSEPIALDSLNEPSVPGMGVYQITSRKKVKNTTAYAAIRHLRRAHRLLERLEGDQALLREEREILAEIDGFLKRNDLI